MVLVRFSSAVRAATNGERKYQLRGSTTIKQVLSQLQEVYGSEFSRRIFKDDQPRKYLNFYVNGKDIRFLDQFNTKLTEGDILDIIPAVAGG